MMLHDLYSEDRDPDDIEDLENMLEWHAMQVCMSICVCVCLHSVRLKIYYPKYNS